MRYLPRCKYSLILNCSVLRSFMTSMLRWKKSLDIQLLQLHSQQTKQTVNNGSTQICSGLKPLRFIIKLLMNKFSLVSNERVRKHLANTSPAKIIHAFPKSPRFGRPNPECKQAFYGSTSSLSNRKSAIGYGKKFDFTRSSVVSPGSPTYRQASSFEKMGRTHSFGIGRDKSPERHYAYHVGKAKVPGPGTYENQAKTRMTISFSHRPRTLDVAAKHLSYLQSPGPGQYESLELNPSKGRFRVSKFNDSKLSIINKDTRFKQIKPRSPSPMLYFTDNIDRINSNSRYIVSSRRGQGTRPFDRERKFTFNYWKSDNSNPGPGTYEKPSDFGVYGDFNYYKTLSMQGGRLD